MSEMHDLTHARVTAPVVTPEDLSPPPFTPAQEERVREIVREMFSRSFKQAPSSVSPDLLHLLGRQG